MLNTLQQYLQDIQLFLKTKTPGTWIQAALNQIPLLLLDHAHCERKAAFTALNLMNKYPDHAVITQAMPALIREEMLHFEKVISLMHKKKLAYRSLKPSRYAKQLHGLVTKLSGPQRLCEELLVGAIIEARSCERFAILIEPLEDTVLSRFYYTLVKSEARHFETYLSLATSCGIAYEDKLAEFIAYENQLISDPDEMFRFHSGVPSLNVA